jgi:OmpA-OmpF porin, OOP family
MAIRPLAGFAGFLSTLALSGCATPERITLLPEADGSPSAIVVQPRKGGEVILDRPYAVASVSERQARIEVADEADIKRRYKAVIEALPERARSYTLNFVFGGTQLTNESKVLLDRVLREMEQIPVPELAIIGHADDVGTDAINDKLSLERANAVLNLIKAKGIELRNVTATGRGKRDPAFAGKPGIPEPRNRRVEIRVK